MNKKNIGILSMVILAVLLISITVFVINKEKTELANQEPKKEYVGVEGLNTVQKSEVVSSLKKLKELDFEDEETFNKELDTIITSAQAGEEVLENFNRESAVNQLKELMISIGEAPENEEKSKEKSSEDKNEDKDKKENKPEDKDKKKDGPKVTESKNDNQIIMDRLALLDNEETDIEDVLTKKSLDMMYFSEDFGNIKFNRQFAASSMLIYHDIIKNATELKDFNPIVETFDDLVYLDSKFMTAHIPLDIFIGSGTGVAFEMQYMNGEWKLNPYTAMMSLNLMGMVNEDTGKNPEVEK